VSGIDRTARDQLAVSLAALIEGRITNCQFVQAETIDCQDSAVNTIFEWAVDSYFDDLSDPYKLVGKHAPTAEGLQEIRRCVSFLKTDLSYEWPGPPLYVPPPFWGFYGPGCFLISSLPFVIFALIGAIYHEPAAGSVFLLVPLGAIAIAIIHFSRRPAWQRRIADYWSHGDKDVWPFLQRADYETAQHPYS
jgi:hypothetical protein